MDKPTKLDYLESAYAAYYYIYSYTKDLDEESIVGEEKTLFAVSYLLEQFIWSLSKILDDDFRKGNPGMDDLNWLILVGIAESEGDFLLEDVPDVIYQHFNLIENFKIFEEAYQREKEKLKSTHQKRKPAEDDKNLPLDTTYELPIYTQHSLWTVRKKCQN